MLKKSRPIIFLFILVLLTLLGCSRPKESNDSAHEGKTPPDKAPQDKTPSLVSITKPLTYSKNQAITPLVLNNTGDPVVRCTIDPDLPNGLEIAADSGSCRITGTLTVTLVQTTFAITGTDAQGQTDTATVSIVVNDETPSKDETPQKSRPPSLVSITEPLVYFKDQAIIPLVVNNTGDPVVSCVINPNLPNGLAIAANSGNCQITGTPTVTLIQTTFTVTATNAEGETDTATVSIVVKAPPPSLVDITKSYYTEKDDVAYLFIPNNGGPVTNCAINPDLPNGIRISVNSDTCRIQGYFPLGGLRQTAFTVTGTNAEGETSTAMVSITATTPPPSLVNITEPLVYSKDQAIPPLVINNTGDPVVGCAINPKLPTGLDIATDGGNCRITGTPTMTLAETAFTITGTDAESETSTATVSIIIRRWSTSILSPTFPLATASDTTITIQTDQDSRISIHKGLNCSGGQVASKNVVDIASNVEITLLASSLKNDNTDTDFSNFFTLCQEDKNQSNTVVKITSFMVHSISVQKDLDAGSHQIGDIWSMVFAREVRFYEANKSRFISSYSHLVRRLFGTFSFGSTSLNKGTVFEIDSAPFPEHFKRLGRSTVYFRIFYNYGTSFYVGKNTHDGKTYYIMATNYHTPCGTSTVCDRNINPIGTSRSVYNGYVSFPVYGYGFNYISFIGAWWDIDFALYAFEIYGGPRNKRVRDINLTNAKLEFDFTSDIYPGQELVMAGYGENHNPKNATYPNKGTNSLMFGFDKDCKVFSPRNDFPKQMDPYTLNPASYSVFSFAHGCEASAGDSGSPVLDRKTGKVVGITWTGAAKANTNSNIKNSEYIHTNYMNKKDAFENLVLAVPAPKIKTFLEDWVTKNNATLSEIQKRLLRKFLDKELE